MKNKSRGKVSIIKAEAAPMEAEESVNENLSARPKENLNLQETEGFDYGEMNLEDAQESGYTDKEGHAVSMTKKDKAGSPTGAYTDIGAGRSSVVVDH